MVSAVTTTKGSAGYVAIELVTAEINGRHGSSVLQPTGLKTRGEPSLTITAVPDSRTDQLTGLSGHMSI